MAQSAMFIIGKKSPAKPTKDDFIMNPRRGLKVWRTSESLLGITRDMAIKQSQPSLSSLVVFHIPIAFPGVQLTQAKVKFFNIRVIP